MPLSRDPYAQRAKNKSPHLPQVVIYTLDTAALRSPQLWLWQLADGLPEVQFQACWLDLDFNKDFKNPANTADIPTELPANVELIKYSELPPTTSLLNRASSGIFRPTWLTQRANRREYQQAVREELWSLITSLCVSDGDGFASSLQQLSSLAEDVDLAQIIRSGAAAEIMLEAWAQAIEPTLRPRLPTPSVADVLGLAEWLVTALRPLERAPPEAELGHAIGLDSAGLLALHGLWRRGTPFLLSEPQVALRQGYLAARHQVAPLGLKTLHLRFARLLCRTVYQQASAIVAGSQRVKRWQEHLGAPALRISVISGGMQLVTAEALRWPQSAEPKEAVLVWYGELRPEQDLETLLRAFDLLRRQRPDARLRLFIQPLLRGVPEVPPPAVSSVMQTQTGYSLLGEALSSEPTRQERYAAHIQTLLSSLRLSQHITLEPAPPQPAEAYRHAQVVIITELDEEVPLGLLPAMALGRPIIAPRVGGVAEVLGDAGILNMPRDLLALTSSLLRLLADMPLRGQLSKAARQRSSELSAQEWQKRYQQLYQQLLDDDDPFWDHPEQYQAHPGRSVYSARIGSKNTRQAYRERQNSQRSTAKTDERFFDGDQSALNALEQAELGERR